MRVDSPNYFFWTSADVIHTRVHPHEGCGDVRLLFWSARISRKVALESGSQLQRPWLELELTSPSFSFDLGLEDLAPGRLPLH